MPTLAQLLVMPPSAEIWEQICAEVDRIEDPAQLVAALAECEIALTEWPDHLRECPADWLSQANRERHRTICRIFPFPEELALFNYYLQADLFDHFITGASRCLALDFNPTRNTLVGLLAEGNEGETGEMVGKLHLFTVNLSEQTVRGEWIAHEATAAHQPASGFLHLADDGTIVAAIRNGNARQLGGEDIVVLKAQKVVFRHCLPSRSVTNYDWLGYPPGSLFAVLPGTNLLFWYSPAGEVGKLDLRSGDISTVSTTHRIQSFLPAGNLLAIKTAQRELLMLDASLRFFRQDTAALHELPDKPWLTFHPKDAPAEAERVASRPESVTAGFHLWDQASDRPFTWEAIAHTAIPIVRRPDYDFRFQVHLHSAGVRIAYLVRHPLPVLMVVELPSGKSADYLGVIDYPNFAFCFGAEGTELIVHDGFSAARWLFELQ